MAIDNITVTELTMKVRNVSGGAAEWEYASRNTLLFFENMILIRWSKGRTR